MKIALKIFYFYIKLLFQKKEKNSVIFIPLSIKGGAGAHFKSTIKYLSSINKKTIVLLNANQISNELINLQREYNFHIEIFYFDIWRTNFSNNHNYNTLSNHFRYQCLEIILFWKIFLKYKAKSIFISVTNPEELLFLFLSPLHVFYIIHTPTNDHIDKLKNIILKIFLGKTKKIICVSEYAKKLLLNSWGVKTRDQFIEIIYNHYDPDFNSKEKYCYSGTTILTLGSVILYKNPFLWIEVAKKLVLKYGNRIDFIWAGDGPLIEESKLLVASYSNINFIGYVSLVKHLYENSAIYFQPSALESQGISVLGAMYHKLPCVVSNIGGLSESVIDKYNGYVVDVNSVDDFVSAIENLIDQPSIRSKMGNNGYIHYQNKFEYMIWKQKMDYLFMNHISNKFCNVFS